ncbi:MAG: hypothetical protein O7F11_07380 [Acidobacteria bacterium]|nr:hypothetical protein [Acidobacteriota bacterium]
MKRILSVIFLPALFLAASHSPARAQEAVDLAGLEVYTERVKTGFVNWGAGYAEVVVEAPYQTQRFGASHAKIRAIEAADEIAKQSLYRLLRGINLTGEKRLAGDAQLEEILRKLAGKQSSLKAQKTVNVTMTATYRMPIYGRKALSGSIRQAAFADSPKGTLAGSSGGSFTSVVFDAAGTTLQAAFFPRILAEDGTLLFGPADLEVKIDAPARYVVRGDGSQKKLRLPKSVSRNLGDNPLIMKVLKVGGEFFTDVVLRPEQVEELRQAQPGDLLSLGKLFIIQTRSIDVSES